MSDFIVVNIALILALAGEGGLKSSLIRKEMIGIDL